MGAQPGFSRRTNKSFLIILTLRRTERFKSLEVKPVKKIEVKKGVETLHLRDKKVVHQNLLMLLRFEP